MYNPTQQLIMYYHESNQIKYCYYYFPEYINVVQIWLHDS